MTSATSRLAEPPRHVAIIMDGNGRWASERGTYRLAGHRAGARSLRRIVRYARELGLRHLTLFALSSENWQRPRAEVNGLMSLLDAYLASEVDNLIRNRIELTAIGNLGLLPQPVRRRLLRTIAATRGLAGMRLILALSYGGRDELTRAARLIAREVAAGELEPDAIDEQLVTQYLDTQGQPDPDLVIRTGGEHRLSNFLLWQSAYAELYVTETRWPDFGRAELAQALSWYRARERRFGTITTSAEPARPRVPSAM